MRKKKKIDGPFIIKEVKRITEDEEGSDTFDLAAVMLCSVVTGPNTDKIAAFLGWHRDRVRKLGRQLRHTGIWRGNKVVGGNWLKDGGGLDFSLDVAVAVGWIEHVPA